MPKKVSFGAKPQKPVTVDEFVSQGIEPPPPSSPPVVKMKRLTLDIPDPLHRAIKRKAAEEGIPMVDMLRALLQDHYGNQ